MHKRMLCAMKRMDGLAEQHVFCLNFITRISLSHPPAWCTPSPRFSISRSRRICGGRDGTVGRAGWNYQRLGAVRRPGNKRPVEQQAAGR